MSKNVLVEANDKLNLSKTYIAVPEYFSNNSINKINVAQY